MSNPFRNIAAGILDIPELIPDTATLIVGPFTGIHGVTNGKGFWEGFADNPFARASEDYYNWVTETTGADDDSFLRTAIGLGPAFTGAGLLGKGGVVLAKTASKAGIKAAKETSKRYLRSNIKQAIKPVNIAKDIANASVPMAAIGLVTPGESEQDKIWNALALGTLGWKGIKRFKGRRTPTDLMRQIKSSSPEVAAQLLATTAIAGIQNGKKRMRLFDDIGGAMDTLSSIAPDIDSVLGRRSIEDALKRNPDVKDLANIINNLGVKNLDLELKFGSVTETMGNRLGSYRDLLEAGMYNNTEALKFLNMSREEAAANYNRLNDLKDISTEFREFVDELDTVGPRQQGIKHGLNNISNKELYEQYEILSKDIGRKHFMTPEMKSFTERVLKQGYEAGAIDVQAYMRGIKDINSGLYIPMRSDEVRDLSRVEKSDNAFRNTRQDAFDYETEGAKKGVNDTGNPYDIWASRMMSDLETVERQKKIEALLDNYVTKYNEALPKLEGKVDKDQLKELGIQPVEYKIFDESDVKRYVKDYNKKHPMDRMDTDRAFKALADKYLKKGLLPISTYTNGKRIYSFVPEEFKVIFNQRPVNDTMRKKLAVALNKPFMASLTSKFNPLFYTRRFMYPFNETIPAVMNAVGKEASVAGMLLMYADAARKSLIHSVSDNMVRAVDNNTVLGMVARGNREFFKKHVDELLYQKLDDAGVISNDIFGQQIRNSNYTVDIHLNTTNSDRIRMAARRAWNWVDNSSLGIVLQIFQDFLDNTSRIFILNNAEKYFKGKEREFTSKLNRNLSDTSRRGTGDSRVGAMLNAIQDYVPYGPAMVQGLMAKLEYLPKNMASRTKQYLKDAYEANGNSLARTGLDAATKVAAGLADLPDHVMFNVLWKFIALPAIICYAWNYGNEENAKYYNSLQPWERSNKFQLVNFLGEGKNLSIPIDQEWSVIKNLFDSMLEYQFGLGEANDIGNPAFSMRDQILWSLDQEFGISLPVAAEVPLNLMGLESNIEPSAVANGELPVQSISNNKYKDVPDNIGAAFISLTGNFGKALINLYEDRPAFDYRYAIPFIQLDPKRKVTSDTVSYLNTQLKLNPTLELQEWASKRRYLMAEKAFYERNGCTRSGKILGKREDVIKDYQRQIDELTRETYYSITE